MGPDYFKDCGKPKKANWRKHERDIAERSGDRRVAGSGNQPGRPGDVMGTRFLRDGKATVRKSLGISQKQARKLVIEAMNMGRIPIFEIRLEGAEEPVPTDWVVIPAIDFEEIVGS
jgi:hypothetical protein